jgi:para-aminobenzoate synthetase/4-amino-4-deoxychorismate lyase
MTVRRADPALGVFETLLVVAGRPIELDAHLARLAASLEELYGIELPAGTGSLVGERAAGLKLGRVRLTARPGRPGLQCEATAAAVDPRILFPGRGRGAELRGLPLPGGLGGHKWADRSALPPLGDPDAGSVRAGADHSGATMPLLLDGGEEVLEAGWANVFAVHREILTTPPADGRILPGVTRAIAIEIAREEGIETVERPLHRRDLLAAEEVFLTSSVRGVMPACALDGVPLAAGDAVSRRVADGLRRRWSAAPLGAAAPAPAGAPPPGPPGR